MEKGLEFKQNTNGSYEAKFVSEGAVTVQIQRKEFRPVVVLANLPEMPACKIREIESHTNYGVIFEVDVPPGIEVTISSRSEISSSKMMSDE